MFSRLAKNFWTYKFFLMLIGLFILISFFIALNLRSTSAVDTDFTFFILNISWYGLIIALGVIVSAIVLSYIRPKEFENMNFLEAVIWVLIPAVICARLWHIASDWEVYSGNYSEMISLNAGGLVIWGALIGGLLGVYLYTLLYGFDFKLALNTIVVVLPLGQGIGRLGNFINQEMFGPPTDLPWGMFVRPVNRPQEYLSSEYYHPAFLYEMIGDLSLFLLLLILVNKLINTKGLLNKLLKIPRDHISSRLGRSYILVAIYLFGYGLIRFFVEFYRIDDELKNGLNLNQLVALFIAFISLSYLLKIRFLK